MRNLSKALTALAALAFVLALATNFTGGILNTTAQGFSRACTNLAVLAIALVLTFGDTLHAGRSAKLP
jgi:hypothetical protein